MKDKIARIIKKYIKHYQQKDNISTKWGEPLVAFADAGHPYILNLKNIISPTHQMPTDVLDDAKTIVVYFVPFTKELAKSNCIDKEHASIEWAAAYEETNEMFMQLNNHLIKNLNEFGYKADISKDSLTFDRQVLISNWSHRHFAYAAGMGTFGVNNMLITKRGCCGRYSSIVTNLDVEHGSPMIEQLCLYKKNKSCGECVKHCPTGALSAECYDREKCYEILLKNAKLYSSLGSSYPDETGKADSIGSEVCGKCAVNIPCAFWG